MVAAQFGRAYFVLPALIAGLLLSHLTAAGQERKWLFRDRAYFEPLVADPRAAQTSVLFPASSGSVPFAANPGRHLAWDISLGREIPIVGWQSSRQSADELGVPQRSFGVGLFLPISFHMIEDLGKDESRPILNTDYRVSGMLKAQWGLPEKWGPVRYGHAGLRYVFLGHESTHLGDEFTLAATRIHGALFQRVNVSYEYWELGGSFEPNFLTDGRLRIKVRGGVIRLYDQRKGWYDTRLLQPFGETVAPSRRNFEPYFGAELSLQPEGNGFAPFVSLDFRDRTVYGYARKSPDEPEETEASINLIVGVHQVRDDAAIYPSYFVRYYHGVNPAGQFRSQKNYQLFGIGVRFHFNIRL